MPAIVLRAFSGEQPRILARLMPDNAAQSARNCRLDDGALTAMRLPTVEGTIEIEDAQTIYRHQGDFLAWASVVNAAPGPVAGDRLYYTGDGAPKMRVGEAVYPLAVPAPAAALTAALGGVGAGDVIERVYVFTWVTSFGEESEPSPASAAINWQAGNTVTLSGFPATPAGRSITKQRIYRSQTGQAGTYLYLIAERNAATGNFLDNIAVDAFQEPLPSADWNAPPAGLAGLIAMPNGMMAAYSGRDLYFSEPYRPHAWPEKYVITVDYPIVGLGAIGSSLIVMTTGMPYVVSGTRPDSMQQIKLEQNLPCINARGIVDLGYAIAYPSHEGLVAARADGSIGIVTTNIFNRDDWLKHAPETMVGGQISGRYVAFYSYTDQIIERAGALIIDLSGQSFLVRSDEKADAAFFEIGSGALYYLATDTDEIRRLDPPTGNRSLQYWKSKKFVMPAPDNFGVILIDGSFEHTPEEQAALEAAIAAAHEVNNQLIEDNLLFGELNAAEMNEYPLGGDAQGPTPDAAFNNIAVSIYADGVLKATVSTINRPVRLPGGFTARTWEVDVFGNVRVESIVMAKTVDELKQAA